MTGRNQRILVLTNLYPGGVVPARGAFVENQVRSLRDLGTRMEVLHIDGARSRLEYLKGAATLIRLASPKRFDLVHAHYGLTGFIGTLQCRLPLVVSYLGTDLYHRSHRRISLQAARRAACNIVKSRAMRDLMGGIPCVVIPSGTDLDCFRPLDPVECRRHMGWAGDDFVALFPWDPGRPEKNYSLAVAAVDAARAGSVSRLRLEAFFGRSQEEYNIALNASDVCLLTSEWEGSPNAVRESLAVGLPVISVPVGDAPAVLEGMDHCRILPRDPGELGRAIVELHSLRESLGSPVRHCGRGGVLRYSARAVAARIARLYAIVLEGERDTAVIQSAVDGVTLP